MVVLFKTPELHAVQLNVIGVMAVFRGAFIQSTLACNSQSTFMENVVYADVRVVLAHTVNSVKSRNSTGVPKTVPFSAPSESPSGKSGEISNTGRCARLRTAA